MIQFTILTCRNHWRPYQGATIVKIQHFNLIVSITISLFLGTSAAWAQPLEEEEEEDKMLTLCEKGNSTACFERGKKYMTLDRDNRKAVELFKKACAQDHMLACLWGGNLIQNTGRQYSPAWKQAAKMFDKACKADEDAACFNLGALYFREGRTGKAKGLFKKACDMGNQIGCSNLEKLSR